MSSSESQTAPPYFPFKQAEVTIRKYILVIFLHRIFANVGQVYKLTAVTESL